MPAVSKAQAGFLGAVAGGKSKMPHKGLSKDEAKEMLRGHEQSELPERSSRKRRRGKRGNKLRAEYERRKSAMKGEPSVEA